jgi:UbiD family decarboxylase
VRPGVRRPEGPFGDHYGYYSLRHDYPVFEVDVVRTAATRSTRRRSWASRARRTSSSATSCRSCLSPLFPLVMPGVRDLWSYGETGYHSLAAAVVKERYAARRCPRRSASSARGSSR